jgi:hypothetical protein
MHLPPALPFIMVDPARLLFSQGKRCDSTLDYNLAFTTGHNGPQEKCHAGHNTITISDGVIMVSEYNTF